MFLETDGSEFLELLINAIFDEEVVPHPEIFVFESAGRSHSSTHESAFKLLQWRVILTKDMSWCMLSVT